MNMNMQIKITTSVSIITVSCEKASRVSPGGLVHIHGASSGAVRVVGEQCVTFMAVPTPPTPLPFELNSGAYTTCFVPLFWCRWDRWYAACTATLHCMFWGIKMIHADMLHY